MQFQVQVGYGKIDEESCEFIERSQLSSHTYVFFYAV